MVIEKAWRQDTNWIQANPATPNKGSKRFAREVGPSPGAFDGTLPPGVIFPQEM
jgi:hypothetical protein